MIVPRVGRPRARARKSICACARASRRLPLWLPAKDRIWRRGDWQVARIFGGGNDFLNFETPGRIDPPWREPVSGSEDFISVKGLADLALA